MAYEKTNWIDGETLINSNNLNKIENGIVEAGKTANNVVDTFNVEDKTTNAPSIRAVEDKLTYSTEEKQIGYWIDGKPIYRKTFKIDSITLSISGIEIGIIPDMDDLINSNIIIKTTNNLKRSGYLSGNYYSGIQVDYDGTITIWGKDGSNTNEILIVTLEYTKTTD